MMRYLYTLAISFGVLCGTMLRAQSNGSGTQGDGALPHRIIVKVSGADPTPAVFAGRLLAPLNERLGIGTIRSWLDERLVTPPTGSFHKSTAAGRDALARIVLVPYSADDPPALVARAIAAMPGVEYAEPVYRRTLSYAPNDPFLGQQWYLEQIDVLGAWTSTRCDSSMIIAIDDTGIDPSHPDLSGALWYNWRETGTDGSGRDRRTNGVDDDQNGFVDDWRGYDFGGTDGFTPDNDPTPFYWHGTHVAGIAGASGDNGIGVAGVAYGARLMSLKITNDEAVSDPLITRGFDGILYAVRMGARIVNCSWGGPGYSRAEQEVIDTAIARGALVVAAAGNSGSNINAYPASYRGVLSVASLVQSGARSTFSNFNFHVGVSAPGESIYSTTLLGGSSNGYRLANGTSMAAPIVSGAAALLAFRYPALTPEQIVAVLRTTSDDVDNVNPDYRHLLGSGRINVARALALGPDAVAAEVIDYSVVQERPDGVIEPGEEIELHVTVRNMLRAVKDLRITLSAAGGTIPVETPLAVFGPIATLEERSTDTGTFRLRLPDRLPLDYSLPLDVTLLDGATPIGTQRIDIQVNPNWSTTSFNRTVVSFAGNGRIAYNDFPLDEQGFGFRIDSSQNLLAEGGILIGVAPDRLADVVRSGGDDGRQSTGMEVVQPYRTQFSPQDNAGVGTARFDDAHLSPSQRIGIDVHLKTLQFTDPSASNITFAFYTITNRSDQPIHGLHCALYLDWDIGPLGVYDQASIDLEHRLGYTRNTRSKSLPFAGTMLLSNLPMDFNALSNSAPPLSGGFFQIEKWNTISSGILRETSEVGDCSMIVGAGPIDIAPGADTMVAFAFMAGANLAELRMAADEARERFRSMGYTPGDRIVLPSELALESAVPDPFVDHADITFAMPSDGQVAIDVFDMRGGHIETLTSTYYTRGTHSLRYTPLGLPNGVYVLQLHALNMLIARKVIHIAQ